MEEDLDTVPLLGAAELTEDERKAVRRMIRDHERADWAWGKLKVLIPILIAIGAAVFNVWDWTSKHIRLL